MHTGIMGRYFTLLAFAASVMTIATICYVRFYQSSHNIAPAQHDSSVNVSNVRAQMEHQLSSSCQCDTRVTTNSSFLEMFNAVEDMKLQHYIGAAKHKIKAVIMFLAHAPRASRLTEAIQKLHKHFNVKYRYPIVIFHESDFLPFVESVRHSAFFDDKNGTTFPIFFQQVNLSVPEWYLRKFGPPPEKSCWGTSIGYRSMCRFQAKLMYEQKVMRHFDYYWRLDDDSSINAMIPYDVFEVLVNGGFSYGFVQSCIDGCAHNIFDVAKNYMNSSNIRPTFFNMLKKNEVVYNNFEVSSMKFWLSKQYQDFMNYIDELGGIYLHRWGDAPIKTLALSMHVPVREIHKYKGISYSHNNGYASTNLFD